MKIGENYAPREIFGKTLAELGAINEKLLVLDADVAASTYTSLFRDKYPGRFFQCGIAEQNMAGIAAGLSTMGFIPFISTFAVFLTQRAGDQVRNSIAHPKANVKLNGSYGGLPTGRAGATHSAFEDVAAMRCLPNMTVLEPADPYETRYFTKLALEIEGPVYIRTVRCSVPVIFDDSHKPVFGKAVKIKKGKDITIISTGMMTPKAITACEQLEVKGISAGLIHVPCLKPIDEDAILEAAEETHCIITVENHSVIGGLGSAVCETVAGGCPCRVHRLGFQDIFLESGDDETLFSRYGMNTNEITAKAMSLLNK
jgi:transketolase